MVYIYLNIFLILIFLQKIYMVLRVKKIILLKENREGDFIPVSLGFMVLKPQL